MTIQSKIKIFYSYSHKDETYREELETHLSLLRRKNVIDEWHDRKIDPGDKWRHEIDEALGAADVVLLLVTPDFLASDFCYEKEMKRALERHADGYIVVIPIIVRPVDFEDSPFAELQALPTDARPVTLWENKDEAWLTVSRGIRKACESRLRQAADGKAEEQASDKAQEAAIVPVLDEMDFGVVDFNAMLEDRIVHIVEAQQYLTDRTNEMGSLFTEKTLQINKLQSYQGRDKARKVLQVAKAMGADLGKYGKDMMELADGIEDSWEDVDRIFPRFLAAVTEEGIGEGERKDLQELAGTLESTGSILGSLRDNMDGAREAIATISKHSAHLKVGGRPATQALNKLRDVFWGIQSSIGQMRRSVEGILEHGREG